MPVYGLPKHPQVLFVGFTEDDPRLLAMVELVPAWRILTEHTDLHLPEWDVLVTRDGEDFGAAETHLYVLSFGERPPGFIKLGNRAGKLRYLQSQPSPVLHIPDDMEGGLRRLVERDLLASLAQAEVRPFLSSAHPQGFWVPATVEDGCSPFISDVDSTPIAGDFQRADASGQITGGRIWTLPFLPDRPQDWLAEALRNWHELAPSQIPLLPGWQTRANWITRNEELTKTAVVAAYAEKERAIGQLDAAIEHLMEEHEAARKAAEKTVRRLLTAHDDDLVSAVKDVLTSFGFGVLDSDENLEPGGAKKEDLRVTDPDQPGWTCIVEVKGYTKGAKASDLQILGRYATVYLRAEGELPQSRWYIVNQNRIVDPDARPRVLTGADDDIAVFADDGGLILDTRELFKLGKAVEIGELDDRSARTALREATGLFLLP